MNDLTIICMIFLILHFTGLFILTTPELILAIVIYLFLGKVIDGVITVVIEWIKNKYFN